MIAKVSPGFTLEKRADFRKIAFLFLTIYPLSHIINKIME